MRIKPSETIAVIVDVQTKLFPHINQHENLENNIAIAIKGLQALNVPIVVTEQYTKGLGSTLQSLQELIKGTPSIEKMTFSCCKDSSFMEVLEKYKSQGVTNVILVGIETHVCVLQTAIDLLEHNLTPVIIENCVSSRHEHDKNIAIERMRQEGAIITTYESVLFELCVVSGTDTFKAISRLVK